MIQVLRNERSKLDRCIRQERLRNTRKKERKNRWKKKQKPSNRKRKKEWLSIKTLCKTNKRGETCFKPILRNRKQKTGKKPQQALTETQHFRPITRRQNSLSISLSLSLSLSLPSIYPPLSSLTVIISC